MRQRVLVSLAVASVTAIAIAIVAGCGGGDKGAAGDKPAAAERVLKMAWGAEPPSLDPGLATDTTSSNVLLNIMDPLVRLGDDLEPVPALAESWQIDGKVVTFHLRDDATLDERRRGDGARLRVLVEADARSKARRRLCLPVVRDRRSGGVQQREAVPGGGVARQGAA